MPEVKVCTGNWNGVHGSTFTWHNPDSKNTATISATSASWPFTLVSPISVAPGAKLNCGLITTPGTYTYSASPCSNTTSSESAMLAKATAMGNPKTVIIT